MVWIHFYLIWEALLVPHIMANWPGLADIWPAYPEIWILSSMLPTEVTAFSLWKSVVTKQSISPME